MPTPYSRAPHVEPSPRSAATHAPNAALLIDFDNVTMGMRSDLSKELRNLLNSDVIKGKVAVQRAYADWRRYPQYIVPLAENSVDLIFAPAYGSSKKNATDIRMAIDGMELIFTRPEIGTFILLTGDSDFSSLVLKLKEYGKYVIGVGIQESSSDLLVQNCDEYYSYTALTGLRRAGDGDGGRSSTDPWVLVERAVEQMVKRRDVMRSDRLKQVMLELDPGFDEGSLGYSKFSRFLTEAAQKGLISITKLENGQYEVGAGKSGAPVEKPSADRSGRRDEDSRRRDRDRDRDRDRGREEAARPPEKEREETKEEKEEREAAGGAPAAPAPAAESEAPSEEALRAGWDLLRRAVSALSGEGEGGEGVRDSDVKRKMLALAPDFDEADLGFSKFSRFLRQAHDQEVIDLRKGENGIYEVALRTPSAGRAAAEKPSAETPAADSRASRGEEPAAPTGTGTAGSPGGGEQVAPSAAARRLQPRVSRRGGRSDGPPPLLEGQVVELPSSGSVGEEKPKEETGGRRGRGTRRKEGSGASGRPAAGAPAKEEPAVERSPERRPRRGSAKAELPEGSVDAVALGLPTDPDEVVRHLTGYKGVGKKTAESLVKAFGADLYTVLNSDPARVRNTVPVARAELVLEGWQADLRGRSTGEATPAAAEAPGADAATEDAAEGTAGGGARRRTRRSSSRKGRGNGRSGGSGR